MIDIDINEQDLKRIQRDLHNLFPASDTKLKNTLRSALRNAAKPMVKDLKGRVPKDTGRLRKSIALINGKTRKGQHPTVYVGPRVKGAFKSKERSGWYFYILNYGSKKVKPGKYLDKTYNAKKDQVASDVVNQVENVIAKRWKQGR